MRPEEPPDSAPHVDLARVWGPLYAALLAAAVLSPGALACGRGPVSWEPAAGDVALNLALFMPLVWLAPPRWRRWAWLAAAAGSGAVEAAQMWLFRTPSLFDWLTNTGGAVLATLLPDPPLTRLPRRVTAWSAVVAAPLALAGVAVWAARTPPPALGGWVEMPVVLGCEEPGKAYFEGVVRGVAVFDRVADGAALTGRQDGVAALPPWSAGGPLYGLDFVAQRYWRDGPGGPAPLELGPLPPGYTLAQDGLRFGPACWALPEPHAAAVLDRLPAAGALSILLDLELPPRQDWQVHRIFSLTRWHMVRDFMTAAQGDRLFLNVRTTTLEDEHRDPVGTVAFALLSDAQRGRRVRVLFAVDAARTRTSMDGACVQERLLVVMGRPFLVGRGVGFTAAVLVALAALGLGRLGRAPAQPALGLLGGGAMMAGVYAVGLAEPLGAAGAGLPVFMATALLAAAWALRASGPAR